MRLSLARSASCSLILFGLGASAACTGTVLTSIPGNGDDGGAGGGGAGGGGGGTGGEAGTVGTEGGAGGSGGGSGCIQCPYFAVYQRGDLIPIYELTPRSEYAQYDQLGTNVGATLGTGGTTIAGIDDTDFGPFPGLAAQFSELTMMNQLAAQIQADNGLSTPPTIVQPFDQARAGTKPFRGKPTDVKFVDLNGQTQLYVPMGGEMSAPGNSVAVFSESGGQLTNPVNVNVGVRPQRVAAHPDGLVFVCSQYSNYISIIDPRTNTLLQYQNKPVEIPTQFFCSDLAFAPVNPATPNPDDQFLFVANRWRHSILKYHLQVERDAANNPYNVAIVDHPVNPNTGQPDPTLDFEGFETSVSGAAPLRLALSEQQDAVYVADGAGGGVARVVIGAPGQPDTVSATTSLGAAAMDVVNIANAVYLPSTMIDRGLLGPPSAPLLTVLTVPPVQATGLDGTSHVVNPGSLYDNTNAYAYEDVRNGLVQLDFQLGNSNTAYYTDNISPEANYTAQQKILTGGLGTAVARNQAGTRIYVANGGNDQVEELVVNTSNVPYTLAPGRTFSTQGHRPYALSLAEGATHGSAGELYVADWGGELVEVIDVASGSTVTTQPTEFATPSYPATNVERGELAFYDEAWSNNGRKACASCHLDWDMQTDGLSFSAGRTAPTTMHKVGTVSNLANERDFLQGPIISAALGFEGQTRDNCRLVEFGFAEGAEGDPTARIGDPNNVTVSASLDPGCRPVEGTPVISSSVANEATIDANSTQEQVTMATHIQTAMGLTTVSQQGVTGNLSAAQAREELLRELDVYTSAQVRVPPNPLSFLLLGSQSGKPSQLNSVDLANIQRGQQVFSSAGCTTCHSTTTTDALGFTTFTDGLTHGPGVDWPSRFFAAYQSDPRVSPLPSVAAAIGGTNDKAQTTFVSAIDFFVPFCFGPAEADNINCVELADPLQVFTNNNPQDPNYAAESQDLALMVKYGFGDPNLGLVPGFVVGTGNTYAVATPSLRGVWRATSLLHNGFAHSLRETVLAPGHPALQAGESGYAIDSNDTLDVHGSTSTLSASDVEALTEYVQSIP